MAQRERQPPLAPLRDSDSHVLTVGSLVAVLTSIAASALAYGAAPATLTIHWTAGAGTYYGPETAPAALVLVAFPALVAGVALGGAWLASQLRAVGEFDEIRRLHAASVLGTLAVLVGAQVVVIIANL
jgi:hypothetical protein